MSHQSNPFLDEPKILAEQGEKVIVQPKVGLVTEMESILETS